MKPYYSLVVVMVCIFCACNKQNIKYPDILLNSENRELKDVYKKIVKQKDSLRIKAADFLLNNMSNRFTYISMPFYKNGVQIVDLYKESADNVTEVLSNIVKTHIGDRSISYFDIDSMPGDLFIENLEYSLKAWKHPYSKNISFNDFCNYILPYRYLNEPLSDYKNYFHLILGNRLDSIYQTGDVQRVADFILDYCGDNFSINPLYEKYMDGQQSVESIIYSGMGDNDDEVIFQSAIFSSSGFPVKIISSLTKKWCCVRISDKWKIIIDNEADNSLFFSETLDEKPFRVIEHPFQWQNGHITKEIDNIFDIPHLLSINSVDVTQHFNKTYAVKIQNKEKKPGEILFLRILTQRTWKYIGWSKVDTTGHIAFSNLVEGGVYSISDFKDGEDKLLENPMAFYINDKGEPIFFNTDMESQNITHSMALVINERKIILNKQEYSTSIKPARCMTVFWDGQYWQGVSNDSIFSNNQNVILTIPDNTLMYTKLVDSLNTAYTITYTLHDDEIIVWPLP